MKKALITGVSGQDGSYLAELLLEKGYEVHGIVRRSSSFNRGRIDHIFKKRDVYDKSFFLHYGDLTDSSSLQHILAKTMPDEIYNLAAQSHVKVSFEVPEYTAQVDAMGTLRLLEAIRSIKPDIRFYQASTSELYGATTTVPQNEETPFIPQSPYAAAKQYSYIISQNYREAYNLFASNGILFNHESPRRGESFVTRKITLSISKIKHGLQEKLVLGNLNAKRDWGYAPEYVEGMWKMLQLDKPTDLVLATGESHTVREFVEEAFKCIDIDIEWQGTEENEKGVCKKTGKVYVEVSPEYYRPLEVHYLQGDASKAKEMIGWTPKVKYKELVKIMMEADLELSHQFL